jgi:hypothetical protein
LAAHEVVQAALVAPYVVAGDPAARLGVVAQCLPDCGLLVGTEEQGLIFALDIALDLLSPEVWCRAPPLLGDSA